MLQLPQVANTYGKPMSQEYENYLIGVCLINLVGSQEDKWVEDLSVHVRANKVRME